MKTAIFETSLAPDGHLYCPEEFARMRRVHFRVIATFDEPADDVSEHEIELAAANDVSHEVLSEREVEYYLGLEEL